MSVCHEPPPPTLGSPLAPRKLATTSTAGESCGWHCKRPGSAAFTAAATRLAGGIMDIEPPLGLSDCAGLPPRVKLLGCGTGAPQ